MDEMGGGVSERDAFEGLDIVELGSTGLECLTRGRGPLGFSGRMRRSSEVLVVEESKGVRTKGGVQVERPSKPCAPSAGGGGQRSLMVCTSYSSLERKRPRPKVDLMVNHVQ